MQNFVQGLIRSANIDGAHLSFLRNFTPVDEITDQKAKHIFECAKDYLAQGIAGQSHSWNKILKETYQGEEKEGDFLFDLVASLDYLVGIYEINVWNEGQLGCPRCGEQVPAFVRVVDGDDGICCNRCWHKP